MRQPIIAAGLSLCIVVLAGCAGGKVEMSTTQPTVQVSGASSNVRSGDSEQFSATLSSTSTGTFTWSVNGIPGGTLALGKVTATGLYRAPDSLPSDNHITITASSVEYPGTVGHFDVTLLNPVPVIESVNSQDLGENLSFTITGKRFVSGAQVSLGGTKYPAYVGSATKIQVSVPSAAVPSGNVAAMVYNPDPGAAGSETVYFSLTRSTRPSRGSATNVAARFLEQASFGPTAAEVAKINLLRTQLGSTQAALSQYVDDQMDLVKTPASTWPDIPNPLPTNPNNPTQMLCGDSMGCVQILWFQNSLNGNDQLRQRTAFALSQIWVISGNAEIPSDSFLPYYRSLNNNAFGSFFQVMNDITLTSGMGYYLDMGNSAKPVGGSIANENYARELLQLFTVGLYMLNDDGTFQLDGNGQRIPSYTEADVQEFARALTGWTYPVQVGFTQNFPQTFLNNRTDRTKPMIVYNNGSQHDVSGKTLLCASASPCAVPGGQTAQQDLTSALTNIFNHPNVPPFISKQLIQHLVTSNPSPAYVTRITNVFKNNGVGVRGDLKAVVKAILLDPEARQGDLYPTVNSDGHLREPVLYLTGILRSFGFSSASAITYTSTGGSMSNIGQNLPFFGGSMGQNVLFSPSVFNYFTPDFAIQNETLLGPEFQLQTSANAPIRVNFADSVVRNQAGPGIDITASRDALAAIAGNPSQLVDTLEQTFMRGQMSTSMKQTIISTVSALPSANNTDLTYRAKMALYLVISSSQYQVIH